MDKKFAIRLSYIVNTWLLLFVVFLGVVFYMSKATMLVIFSIPTLAIYIFNYFLIYSRKMTAFVLLVYFWIILYMGVTTIGMGYNYGFHLYCISLIPVIFYTEYIAYKIYEKKIGGIFISLVMMVMYIAESAYSIYHGAIYVTDIKKQITMMAINSLVVLGFIIVYSMILVRMVIKSEEKLKKLALSDQLTGLNNRYYMIDQIKKSIENPAGKPWIAMIDIDDFKKVNDQYGHNAGDYVLVTVGEIMTDVCKKCVIGRWGGEEFLILGDEDVVKMDILEKLRKKILKKDFIFEEKVINVSVTAGVAAYQDGFVEDSWIQCADKKLYSGKNSGKNVVVW